MALASGDRGQPSAAFCTLGNPLNLVSELRDLMSWPPWPTSILGHGSPVALTQAHLTRSEAKITAFIALDIGTIASWQPHL